MAEAKIDFGGVVDALPGLVWTTQSDRRSDFVNRAWREYTGLALDKAIDRGWPTAIQASVSLEKKAPDFSGAVKQLAMPFATELSCFLFFRCGLPLWSLDERRRLFGFAGVLRLGGLRRWRCKRRLSLRQQVGRILTRNAHMIGQHQAQGESG